MSFAVKLREIRKAKGLTMKELGAKLSLAESTISGYENGLRKPDLDVLIGMSKVLDVSVDYLLETDNTYEVIFENWLLEIHFAPENKKKVIKKIWEEVKDL